MADDPGYKLSRAALRQRYGSRAITSGGQSARDTTPSGREAYAMQQGASPSQARAYSEQQFRAGFGPQEQIITPIAANIPPVGAPMQRPVVQGGLATPEDINRMVTQGAQGTVKTPYGTVTLPPTPTAEALSEFMPASVSPLGAFGLPRPKTPYMGGILAGANKWRMPV